MQTVPYMEYMRRIVGAFENGLASGNMRPFDSLVAHIGVVPAPGEPAVDHGDALIQEPGTVALTAQRIVVGTITDATSVDEYITHGQASCPAGCVFARCACQALRQHSKALLPCRLKTANVAQLARRRMHR
jgi:hypothetical protein